MHYETKCLSLSGLLLALALMLPFLTGQLQSFGNLILPMHYPIMICGLICGWKYGLVIGLMAPVLRSLLFGMPVFYPSALAMAVELGTYGLLCGFPHQPSERFSFKSLLVQLLLAMLCGRLAWGILMWLLLHVQGGLFTLEAFLAGAFFNAWPGILLQLLLIPFLYKGLLRLPFVIELLSLRRTCDAS